jgi:hypothetical protein
VAGCGALALLGFIGTGDHDERFESKFVTIQPAGGEAVQLTEVVDEDFGNENRHGYEHFISNDYGVPTDITAASPDAPDEVNAVQVGSETRIRIGDPGTTVSAQHRYVLRYTLPQARLSTGLLALDIIDTSDTLPTDRLEIVVTGFELESPTCNIGASGASGGCELTADGNVYRALITGVQPGQGVTIGGTIVGTRDPIDVVVPAVPIRRDPATVPLAAGIVALGATGSAAAYSLARRRGRNEVFGGGGAADAAFGQLAKPGLPIPAEMSTTLIADDRMASLATIEFVPPTGVAPWQGSVVLNERLDDSVVAAWFSGLAAADVVIIEQDDDKDLTIRPGAKLHQSDAPTVKVLESMFNGRDHLKLGTYDKHFATAWSEVKTAQQQFVDQSGWWKRSPPGSGSGLHGAGSLVAFVVVGALVFGFGSAVTAVLGAVRSVPLALLFGLIVPAVLAWSIYSVLLPARSGTGSAIALRTESFRRFLQASEGKHVDWAWKQGLLREYSAWAVSLGAADAWGKALESSNVPQPEIRMNTPLLIHSMQSSMSSTHTPPSSSSSGGSSGFSGGSVGGGGGGGHSGSW